ncbi:MAG: efflux RND transporter periplasmic adaptor subunit [Alphaproteobacteria bacterium]
MTAYAPNRSQRSAWSKIFLILLLLALGYGGYRAVTHFVKPAQAPGGFAMPVESYRLMPDALDVTIESVGSLRANESATLRPELAGRITEVLFTEGALVKKGAPLFKMDDRIYAAELKQAEANLQLAKLNYGRFKKLAKSGASSRQRLDEAEASLGVAQANYDLARTRVAYTTITAPFAGTVGLRRISPGDYVTVGQELANFVSYDPMKVDFSIPETQSRQLRVGQKIDITVEAVPGQIFAGEVFAIDPQVDVSGRAVALRATIENHDFILKPGFFARVSLLVERKPNALLVPEAAIVPQGNDKFVYRITPENTVTLTPVTLGARKEGRVEILSGLNAGDQVVTSGQIKLREGAAVSLKPPGAPQPKG